MEDTMRRVHRGKNKPERTGTADDVGPEVIEFLFESMRIDNDWSVRETRGFTWWGHTLAQRVWADLPRESQGTIVVRVHAETALFREVAYGDVLVERLELLNREASLSGFVLYPDARRVALHCAVTLHQGNRSWGQQLLLGAAGAQAADAHVKVKEAGLCDAIPDTSGHPTNGTRVEPDELLSVLEAVFVPEGAGPSPFAAGDFERTQVLLSRAGLLAFADRDGLTAEFPFTGARPAVVLAAAGERTGVETALLRVSSTQRHPNSGAALSCIWHCRSLSRDHRPPRPPCA
jgi:hypothetical protein